METIQEYQWLHGDFFENIYGSVTTTIAGYSSCRQKASAIAILRLKHWGLRTDIYMLKISRGITCGSFLSPAWAV
jgi:hypothetical protein